MLTKEVINKLKEKQVVQEAISNIELAAKYDLAEATKVEYTLNKNDYTSHIYTLLNGKRIRCFTNNSGEFKYGYVVTRRNGEAIDPESHVVTLAKDFYENIDELRQLSKNTDNDVKLIENDSDAILSFVKLTGWLVVLIGVLAFLLLISSAPDVGIAILVSILPITAILFSLVRIIELLKTK